MIKNIGKGGTGIIANELLKRLDKSIFDKFQIVCDRVENLHDDKIRIFWSHLYPSQSEEMLLETGDNPKPLANGGWKNFHKIVFISHYQMEKWIEEYQIPRNICTVIKYAINPLEVDENKCKEKKNKIKLIYTSNPNKGLSLLVNVFNSLCEEYNNLELNLFSSWKIYQSKEHPLLKYSSQMQYDFEKSDLYLKIKNNPNIKNHGCVSNDEIHDFMISSDIFAYPCILPETFCLSLLESMSAKCLCVHPNYGCLPETASNWTMMYDYHEKKDEHEKRFLEKIKNAIHLIQENNNNNINNHLELQKKYVDYIFNWDNRISDWNNLFESLKNFSYKKVKNISNITY